VWVRSSFHFHFHYGANSQSGANASSQVNEVHSTSAIFTMADAEATYTAQHAPGEGQRVVVARRAALGPGVDVPAAARNSDDGLVCGPVVIRIAVDGSIASVTLPRPPSGDGGPAAEGTPSVESIAQTLTASGDTVTVCDVLLPGFVDIHTHGRGGAFDMSEFWLNPDFTTSRLPAMATTSLLASMVFCCGQVDGLSSKAMQTYAHLSGKVGKTGAGAVIEGVHAEGATCDVDPPSLVSRCRISA
jgi:hypothetical protein